MVGNDIAQGRQDTFAYLLASVAMLGLLVADVRALAWTAMWQSVVKKNAREAQQETFSRLIVLPWLVVALVSCIGLVFGGPQGGVFALILSWTVASAFADGHFAAQARDLLEKRLTLWAVRRSAAEFEHYDGWKNLGRSLGVWWALRNQRL